MQLIFLSFKTVFFLVFGLVISLGSSASSYLKIGNTTINVEHPLGFLETSKNSSELWDLAQLMVSGKNEIIAHYVSKRDLDDYNSNKSPKFEKYFTILTPKSTKNSSISQEDFEKLRHETISMQNTLRQNIEPRVNHVLGNLSDDLSLQLKKDVSLAVDQTTPISINVNRKNLLSYSVLSRINVSDQKNEVSQVMISTTGIVLLKGKILLLNSYSNFENPQDLQYSREAIESWANSIISLNP